MLAIMLSCLPAGLPAWDQAKIRAGISSHMMALSADGLYILVADHQPHSLLVLDALSLKPIKSIEVKDSKGRASRVSAVWRVRTPPNGYTRNLADFLCR